MCLATGSGLAEILSARIHRSPSRPEIRPHQPSWENHHMDFVITFGDGETRSYTGESRFRIEAAGVLRLDEDQDHVIYLSPTGWHSIAVSPRREEDRDRDSLTDSYESR
jgi:hypothetical protein